MAMVLYRLKRINKIKRINFFILSINMNQKKNNATFILISSCNVLSVVIVIAEALLAAPNNESVNAIAVLLNNFILVPYQFYLNVR